MFGFSKGVLVQGNDVLCFMRFFVFAEFVGIKSACKSYDCFVECELYIYTFKYVCIVIYAKMLLFLITSIAITFALHAFL